MKKEEYKKMDPEAKKLWLKALRSGKYKQGTGVLKSIVGVNPEYCCLGVLSEVCNVKQETKIGCGDYLYVDFHFSKKSVSNAIVPLRFKGLTKKAIDTLIDLNDNQGYDFKQIAKWISKNL